MMKTGMADFIEWMERIVPVIRYEDDVLNDEEAERMETYIHERLRWKTGLIRRVCGFFTLRSVDNEYYSERETCHRRRIEREKSNRDGVHNGDLGECRDPCR